MTHKRSKYVWGNSLLALGSLVLAVIAIEFASRLLFPISPGMQALDRENRPIATFGDDTPFRPNVAFRQVSAEYDVWATTTELGFRAPAPQGAPEIVFVGDSFTFGQGLADDETIPAQFCKRLNVPCANLGRPGTGTHRQLDYLDFYLTRYAWPVRQVKLLFFGSTEILVSGNDLVDNLAERQAAARASDAPPVGEGPQDADASELPLLPAIRTAVLAHSNLVRILYFVFGPQLRSAFSSEPEGSGLELSLEELQAEIRRFARMAEEFGFTPQIYVLSPMQDVVNGRDQRTVETLRSMASDIEVRGTADAIRNLGYDAYYRYDGHLNASGARRVAETLVADHVAVFR